MRSLRIYECMMVKNAATRLVNINLEKLARQDQISTIARATGCRGDGWITGVIGQHATRRRVGYRLIRGKNLLHMQQKQVGGEHTKESIIDTLTFYRFGGRRVVQVGCNHYHVTFCERLYSVRAILNTPVLNLFAGLFTRGYAN